MTPIGMILKVVKTAADTQGKSLEMEWKLLPQTDGTPPHIHPYASETYRVLEGMIEVSLNDRWHQLHQGEELTVPAGVPHTFRNPSEYVTRVYNIHAPAMEFEGYFEDLGCMVTKLAGESQERLHMNFKTATYLAMLMKKYSKEIVSVNPPDFIVSLLNFIGKARHFKI
ncbi:cupin domain-containing protein [Pontibacter burrus]|uniref:Cupin domain-containing protein n=1 Tax=Pontibacter burrus TaxID=2704466 RepID=A0A6B3LU21_9BACT|nr:cupin domain-containing protein [Pontibacter burrus]NEM97498.1 cupin domain-containing protein [Pontibacter burrus]